MIRLLNAAFFLLLVMVTTNCQKTDIQPPAPVPAPSATNVPPSRPSFTIERTQTAPDEVHLAVKFAKKSTDAEGDPIKYRYEWLRNDEAAGFPVTQTDVIVKQPADERTGPFESQIDEATWRVVVTPIDPYGSGETSAAETTVRFERHCEPFPKGYVMVDCDDFYSFTAHLGESMTPHDNAKLLVLKNVIDEHMLALEGTDEHDRMVNFVDLLLKTWIHKPSLSKLPHDPQTYLFAGQVTTAPAVHLNRSTCIDVPLVGPACLNSYLYDVDNEPGHRFFDFGPLADQAAWPWPPEYQLDATQLTSAHYGDVTITEMGDAEYDVAIRLKATLVDLLFEPPVDPRIEDCPNSAVTCGGRPYTPKADLSAYLKGYGKAKLATSFEVAFRVSVPDSFDELDFDLRTVRFPDSDFQFIFRKGPYCTTNLGITDTPLAGVTHASIDKLPFNALGEPLYAGLISDTSSGTQGGADVLTSYEYRYAGPYPRKESSLYGGSGVGRDRLGVRTPPYAFDLEKGWFSDNPNNCIRPADACNFPGIQDGSLEFHETTSGCELPNVANSSDDATYRISEQITSIIPYIQGEIKVMFNHEFQ